MKIDAGNVNAVPSKRLFLSIIADYDLNRSICELIDNGLDVWTRTGRQQPIVIDVHLDPDEQSICVEDDAGGLPREDLGVIVGPGQSGSVATAHETIGIFGVGTKRAVVALAKQIVITTRYQHAETFQIGFDESWLNDEDWVLKVHQVDNLPVGTTRVELYQLRLLLNDDNIKMLRHHLSATYANFLIKPDVTIRLNSVPLEPRFFDNWAYPPEGSPQRWSGPMRTPSGKLLRVDVIAGLSNESSPATGDYGVYFYCNNRLVAPAMKSFEVGFTRGQAGMPHPKVSLTKVIVSLNGDADEMPWNSSKSDVSTKHHVFTALHDWLVTVVKHYATLSRTWEGQWPDKVFAYDDGDITFNEVDDFLTAKRAVLPNLPVVRPRLPVRITKANSGVAQAKPYVVGLYEGVVAARTLVKQDLSQRNWLAFNLLDVSLTGALKEYLVNDAGTELSSLDLAQLINRDRHVSADLRARVPLPDPLWTKVEQMGRLRHDLTFGRTAPKISDEQLAAADTIVSEVLAKLFNVTLAA